MECRISTPPRRSWSARVVGEPARDLGQDRGRRVDEHPPLRDVPQARVVADGVVDELLHLCQRLDPRVSGADEDEAEVPGRSCGVGLGEVEPADDVVTQVDGVGEALERHRVLGQSRDRQHPRGRAEGDDQTLVRHLDHTELGVDRDGPRVLVQRGRPPAQQLGVRTHHPERHECVPGLDGSGRDLREQRRVEHRALGADDRGARVPEQPGHVGSPESSAEDERSVLGQAAALELCWTVTGITCPGAGRRPELSRCCRRAGRRGADSARGRSPTWPRGA